MVAGIVVNTIAAVFVGLSTVLLRRVAAHTDLSDGARLITHVVRKPLWWTGIASFMVGIFLTARSFQLAPVAVVQPFAALSLVVIVILAAPLLGERPQRREFIGIVMIIVGLFVSLSTLGEGRTAYVGVAPLTFVIVIGGLVAFALVLLLIYRSGLVKEEGKRAALIGVVSGTVMGVAASMLVIVGARRAAEETGGVVPPVWFSAVAWLILIVCGIWSINRLQHSLRVHTANRVAPTHQVFLLLIPIVVALTAFGQTLPGGVVTWLLRLLALALVFVGVAVMSTTPALAEDLDVTEGQPNPST
ncbi:MAG: EamA family transporter [Actinomycetia bacterium]|nr:EamA family transporter [Actinomycetes bacterium]